MTATPPTCIAGGDAATAATSATDDAPAGACPDPFARWRTPFLPCGAPKPSDGPVATVAAVAPSLPDPNIETIERAAIMATDGGLPEGWAAALARHHPDRPPLGITLRDWALQLDLALRFADRHACDLEALGWSFADLFDLGASILRGDTTGAAWHACEALEEGGRLLEATARRIVYRNATGARFTIWRRGTSPDRIGSEPENAPRHVFRS